MKNTAISHQNSTSEMLDCITYEISFRQEKNAKGIIAGFFRYISDKDNYEL